MPVGQSMSSTSSGQIQPDPAHQLEQRRPGQARLHQVPVAEQHGVGDRAEEGRADERAGDRQQGGVAGVDAGRDQADECR